MNEGVAQFVPTVGLHGTPGTSPSIPNGFL